MAMKKYMVGKLYAMCVLEIVHAVWVHSQDHCQSVQKCKFIWISEAHVVYRVTINYSN